MYLLFFHVVAKNLCTLTHRMIYANLAEDGSYFVNKFLTVSELNNTYTKVKVTGGESSKRNESFIVWLLTS